MLNPSANGYRPEFWKAPPAPKVERTEPTRLSAQITCSTYDGNPTSYALREVRPYSEIMHPEMTEEENIPIDFSREHHEIQINVSSGIIYQEASLAG